MSRSPRRVRDCDGNLVDPVDLPRDLLQPLTPAQLDLLAKNRGFALSQARKFARFQGYLSLDDLCQESLQGMIEAVRRFDPSRGAKFITFAGHYCNMRLRRAIQSSGPVYVPQHARQRDRDSIPHHAHSRLSILSRGSEDGDRTPRGTIFEESLPGQENPEGAIIHNLDIIPTLRPFLMQLTPRERQVIEARFGIARTGRETFREIAEVLEVSRERVRQIEQEALSKLRRAMRRAEKQARWIAKTARVVKIEGERRRVERSGAAPPVVASPARAREIALKLAPPLPPLIVPETLLAKRIRRARQVRLVRDPRKHPGPLAPWEKPLPASQHARISGEEMVRLRHEAGIPQNKLSRLTGFCTSYLSLMESGRRPVALPVEIVLRRWIRTYGSVDQNAARQEAAVGGESR